MNSRLLFYLTLGVTGIAALPALSQGGLLITPTRVVFEGRSRTETLSLINRSGATRTYRIFFSEKRMDEQGTIVDLAPGEQGPFASPMVRFSPRRVTLEPGQTQKVRLQWRPGPDLDPGEYRSHLVFQVSPQEGGFYLAQPAGEAETIGIRLTPLVGAAIPIIVRRGDIAASVRLADARINQAESGKPASLSLLFQREGERSVYGDVQVQWLPDTGEPRDIGFVKGMALYPEVAQRHLEVPLTLGEDFSLDGGQLAIRYTSAEHRSTVLTEYRLQVP